LQMDKAVPEVLEGDAPDEGDSLGAPQRKKNVRER